MLVIPMEGLISCPYPYNKIDDHFSARSKFPLDIDLV